ncbi:unnamed protein product [Ranitomeya imitator]|uniref:Ciliogenesis-associated TTC17-interacting protein n=1 Tax=Ranitomeya imitator TaxID=111125 RepID=A0ABN9MQF2_9NEOB|nr:unnamed protein product [Ranitomeya imitator]
MMPSGSSTTEVEISEPPKPLSASAEAVECMSSVGLDELHLCLFPESLQSVSASSAELGSFTVSVQSTYYEQDGLEDEKCFLVHISSHSSVDDVPCGSAITVYACTRCNLALRRRVLRRTENELQSNIAASMQPAGKERVNQTPKNSAHMTQNQSRQIQVYRHNLPCPLGNLNSGDVASTFVASQQGGFPPFVSDARKWTIPLHFPVKKMVDRAQQILFEDDPAQEGWGIVLSSPSALVHKAEWVLHNLEEASAPSGYVSRTTSFQRLDILLGFFDAYISLQLETLEQHHHEFIKLKGHSLDKKTDMTRRGDQMVISRVITEGQQAHQESKSYDLSSLTGFISEASNLLIMRLLARRKTPQTLDFLTLDAEMNLCVSSYRELGPRLQIIGKDSIEVYGIERAIHSDDLPVTWQCCFLPDGHMTSRIQVGSPVTMRITQMPILSEPDEEDPKPVFEKKPLIWEEDPQLHSQFLERKEELVSDHETYLRRHPEMKTLLADFMQFLLLRKPEDVVTFAAEFFGPFSSTQERGETFQSSTISSPFQEGSK